MKWLRAVLLLMLSLGLCAGSGIVSFIVMNAAIENNGSIIENIIKIEDSITTLRQNIEIISDSIEMTRRFTFTNSGNTPDGLEKIERVIRNTVGQYEVSDFVIKKSKWIQKNKTKEYSLFSSEIDIYLNSFTDIEAMVFLCNLMTSIPGYLQINHLKINKNRTVTDVYIKDIENNSDVTPAISVNAHFVWYVVIDNDKNHTL